LQLLVQAQLQASIGCQGWGLPHGVAEGGGENEVLQCRQQIALRLPAEITHEGLQAPAIAGLAPLQVGQDLPAQVGSELVVVHGADGG
jgi:hypothetical protein